MLFRTSKRSLAVALPVDLLEVDQAQVLQVAQRRGPEDQDLELGHGRPDRRGGYVHIRIGHLGKGKTGGKRNRLIAGAFQLIRNGAVEDGLPQRGAVLIGRSKFFVQVLEVIQIEGRAQGHIGAGIVALAATGHVETLLLQVGNEGAVIVLKGLLEQVRAPV